jgi:hypothetical protein
MSVPADRAESIVRAEALAQKAEAAGFDTTRILNSRDYATLCPGWVSVAVTGLSTHHDAEAAASKLKASGFSGAYPRLISRSGVPPAGCPAAP